RRPSPCSLHDALPICNGDLWIAARTAPARYVNWVLIEERAEGGDELAARARSDEQFLAGLERVAEAGGLALYRRTRQPGGPASEDRKSTRLHSSHVKS